MWVWNTSLPWLYSRKVGKEAGEDLAYENVHGQRRITGVGRRRVEGESGDTETVEGDCLYAKAGQTHGLSIGAAMLQVTGTARRGESECTRTEEKEREYPPSELP